MKIMAIVDPHLTNHTPSSRVDDYPNTMLGKLADAARICHDREVDYAVVTGDVFNSKDISYEYMNKVVKAFKAFPCMVGTIYGNHDLRYDRVDTIDSVPLGTLLCTGSVFHLERVGGCFAGLYGCDYKTALPMPDPSNRINILVAHYSYGDCWGEKGLEDKDLAGFQMAILGHDHASYPTFVTESGCVVVRPGSISRGTAGETDRSRTPQVAIIDLEAMKVEMVPLAHRPSAEVFSQQAIEVNAMKSEMRDYVKSLGEGAEGSGSPVLSELVGKHATDPEVRARVTHHLTEGGLL